MSYIACEMRLPTDAWQLLLIGFCIGLVLAHLVREEFHIHVVKKRVEVLQRQGLWLIVLRSVHIVARTVGCVLFHGRIPLKTKRREIVSGKKQRSV